MENATADNLARSRTNNDWHLLWGSRISLYTELHCNGARSQATVELNGHAYHPRALGWDRDMRVSDLGAC